MEPARSDVSFRPAEPSDRGFVYRLSVEAFSRFGDYGSWLPDLLDVPDYDVVVAVSGEDALVGLAILSIEPGSPPRAELQAIAVTGRWQGQGTGRRLLARMEQLARERLPGVPQSWMHLTVAEDNARARRMFERAGYQPVPGDLGFYPSGQRSLGLRKRL